MVFVSLFQFQFINKRKDSIKSKKNRTVDSLLNSLNVPNIKTQQI